MEHAGIKLAALLVFLPCMLGGGCSSSQGSEGTTGPGPTTSASVAHRATYVAYSETANAPPGTVAGDLMIAGVIGQDVTGPASGWTPIGATTRCGPPGVEYNVYYAWRIRQAGDSAYAFARAAAVQIAAYSGVDATLPLGAFQVARHDGTRFELGPLSSDAAGDAAHYQSLGVFHGIFTPPAGYTERQDGADATTAGDRLGLQAGQGTGGTLQCTDPASQPLTDDGVHLHVVLRARRS